MREIRGDMFSYIGRMKFKLFITTNGFVKNDGTAVMGRGNAAQAVKVFREQGIDLPDLLGKSLRQKGNVIARLTTQLYSFPVKENWFDKGSLKLIKKSVEQLQAIIKEDAAVDKVNGHDDEHIYVLPRPGCGNGQLKWNKVKPLLKSLPENVWVMTTWEDPMWKS